MAEKNDHRMTVRLPESLYKNLMYWATRHQMNGNDYIIEAIEMAIRHENKDYDLPTLEIARLNQLIDGLAVLSQNVYSLEHIVTCGFDSLTNLTRGDNYLLESEDGELV